MIIIIIFHWVAAFVQVFDTAATLHLDGTGTSQFISTNTGNYDRSGLYKEYTLTGWY